MVTSSQLHIDTSGLCALLWLHNKDVNENVSICINREKKIYFLHLKNKTKRHQQKLSLKRNIVCIDTGSICLANICYSNNNNTVLFFLILSTPFFTVGVAVCQNKFYLNQRVCMWVYTHKINTSVSYFELKYEATRLSHSACFRYHFIWPHALSQQCSEFSILACLLDGNSCHGR